MEKQYWYSVSARGHLFGVNHDFSLTNSGGEGHCFNEPDISHMVDLNDELLGPDINETAYLSRTDKEGTSILIATYRVSSRGKWEEVETDRECQNGK